MLLTAMTVLVGLYVARCTEPEAPEPMKSPISRSLGSMMIVKGSPVVVFFMHLELTAKPSFLKMALEDFISIEELLKAFLDLE